MPQQKVMLLKEGNFLSSLRPVYRKLVLKYCQGVNPRTSAPRHSLPPSESGKCHGSLATVKTGTLWGERDRSPREGAAGHRATGREKKGAPR